MNIKKDTNNKIIRNILLLLSGLFWTITYLLIIKRGFQDSIYGMPVIALCANLSWEFIFSFKYIQKKPQRYVNKIWLFFDVIILYQYLKFGKFDFVPNLPLQLFYPMFIGTFILSYFTILYISEQFDDTKHGKYAAFGQNLLMSILFIVMLLRRNSLAGQSIYIALFKMLGTITPSIAFYKGLPKNKLLNFLYISIFIFDLIYFVLIYQMCLTQGVNPWLRL